ncbi:MAG TPA: NUDIX hydrolase [Candidatus Limnocylindria bacterium]
MALPPSRIHVTVDVVIVTRGRSPRVLLVKRKHRPFQGKWAIPGGFVEPDEDLDVAARRELREETGVTSVGIQQLRAFGAPGRDPRGRTVTIAFLASVPSTRAARGGDDASEARWWPLATLPPLAFDHAEILRVARAAIRRARAPRPSRPRASASRSRSPRPRS